ncbi:MAG TPA: universal stress protein [Longimicrobium sp.]|nr:universal stress protein [Longimicrobium sp.]
MTGPIQSIVLGVASLSGDDPGGATHQDPAFASAVALARALHATLHAVHVFELPAPALAGLDLPPPGLEMRERWRAEIGRRLHEQAARFSGVEVVCHAIEGSPAVTLRDVAARLGAALLVVGATRRGRFWRGILGSTAEGVVRAATVPVLVLHEPLTMPMRRVLLTTDLSDESMALLRRGMGTVRSLAQAASELELLAVVSVDPLVTQPHAETELLSRAGEAVHRIAAELGRNVGGRVRGGEPAVEIMREAEEWKADVVVLGTHGRSGYRPLWLGSTATAAARAVSCNVLVIPGAAESAPAAPPRAWEEQGTAALV